MKTAQIVEHCGVANVECPLCLSLFDPDNKACPNCGSLFTHDQLMDALKAWAQTKGGVERILLPEIYKLWKC
jgi:hypothetical protein